MILYTIRKTLCLSKRTKCNIKYAIFPILLLIVALHVFGVITMLFEERFSNFHWPYDGDISEAVYQLRSGLKPELQPINTNSFAFPHDAADKCRNPDQQIRIVYVIKSDPEHFTRRSVIRSTWGFQKRFSDVEIRTVFLLGQRGDAKLQQSIDEEYKKHSDIVQANFLDTYLNNTVKTLSGFKWAVDYCPDARFYMFVDDDYYVSTKNVLRFLRHPTNYPNYMTEAIFHQNNIVIKRQAIDFDLPQDVKLFSGYVFPRSSPKRSILSKWYVTLKQYPYNVYPAYITAGAYILSKEALLDIYYTSFYVETFKFDDVYLGILALRSKIEVFHCDEFYFSKKYYSNKHDYKFTIASHGYSDPYELLRVWNEQKNAGNA